MPKKAEPALFEVEELAPAPDKLLTDALDAYNEIASRVNIEGKAKLWNQAKLLTDARRKRLKIAIQDCGGLIGWRKVLEDASKNNWLLGKEGRSESHRNWIPDLDFFIQPKTVIKLVEGTYAPSITTPSRPVIPMAYAPRPGTVEAPFVPEHPDIRDAAAILSWRKIGRYDKANEVEERLAKRQGRPAVLVPAPEVAREGLPSRSAPTARKPAPTITDVPDWTAEEVPMASYADMVPE